MLQMVTLPLSAGPPSVQQAWRSHINIDCLLSHLGSESEAGQEEEPHEAALDEWSPNAKGRPKDLSGLLPMGEAGVPGWRVPWKVVNTKPGRGVAKRGRALCVMTCFFISFWMSEQFKAQFCLVTLRVH